MTCVKVGSELLGMHVGIATHVYAAALVVEMAEPPPAFAVVLVVFTHGYVGVQARALVQAVAGRQVSMRVLDWLEAPRQWVEG